MLHPRVLEGLATKLGRVFALFQQSIDRGDIANEWSLVSICPLFKKAEWSLACNYRLVSSPASRIYCMVKSESESNKFTSETQNDNISPGA